MPALIRAATQAARNLIVGGGQEFVFRRTHPQNGLRFGTPIPESLPFYVHIPFCKTLCPHCPYNKITYERSLAGAYTAALIREIEQAHRQLGSCEVPSIYIGGGTPTLLIDELPSILDAIRSRFRLTGKICLETSPQELTQEKIARLEDMGISMLSIGAQSFDDERLRFLGRSHTASLLREVLPRVLAAKFDSVNVDLIFAYRDQTAAQLRRDIDEVLATGATQLTCYPLFTFPHSAAGEQKKLQRIQGPGILRRRSLYRVLHEHCLSRGLERTSVWGFKKAGDERFSSV
ncbi:MAG: radical SAM protein, partial [Elusimicrobia bacterium]|nr:radical SAM protein [Elusimicrobiota bacterium]